MNRSPIRKVLSLIQRHQVRCLLMGGQACIFYGAAEFSRDIDIALLLDRSNVARFRELLVALAAEPIAVPAFELRYLRRGHAVHFRCRHPEAENIRLDVMATMRGIDPFPELWERRTTVSNPDGDVYELLSLPDLVMAKKTQRDKDWPMIRRLVEASYFENSEAPSEAHIGFWLRELRTPELLIRVAQENPAQREQATLKRTLLALAAVGDAPALEEALFEEERAERERDRLYWEPLSRELGTMRSRRRSRPADESGT